MSTSSSTPGKSYLHVHRQKTFAAALRKVEIWIDEVKIGTLKNGESKAFEIMPGKHITVAKMSPFFRSSEIQFSVEEGATQHFCLRTSGMNIKALVRLRLFWLCTIPLAWFPYLVYFHVIPKFVFRPLYWITAALLFYFLLFFRKKQPGLRREAYMGGFYYQVCIPNCAPEKKKKWELGSLFRLYSYLICVFGVFFLTWKAPWFWHKLLGTHWFAMMQSIDSILLYFLTGVIYRGMTYTVPESTPD